MKTEDFYPPKCPICYYNNTCNHKDNPSPTRGCYTHKRDCQIWAGNNPTTEEEGNCTCGFNKFDFNNYFCNYYENPQGSQPPAEQARLDVFPLRETRNTPRSKATDTLEDSRSVEEVVV